MIVRAIDPSGDWIFGKGRNDYLKDNDAVAQCLVTRLRSFLGDCFFDIVAGIDWFNLLGAKDADPLKSAVRTVILNTQSVTKLVELSIDVDAKRQITISYTVYTVFPGTIKTTARYILTEDGDILVTEAGDPIHV